MKKINTSFKLTAVLLFFCTVAYSQVSFKVNSEESKVFWKGYKITGDSHNGEIGIKSGEVKFENNKITGGDIKIDMNSITCLDLKGGKANKLVGHLKNSDFFNVPKFPFATYKVKGVKYVSDNKVQISGDITIKNITKPLTFDASVAFKKGEVIVEASKVKINRTLFYVEASSGFLAKVKDIGIADDFMIDIKIVANAKLDTGKAKEKVKGLIK